MISSFNIFCQTEEPVQQQEQSQQTESKPVRNYSTFISLGPQIMYNSDSGNNSAPSPINYSFGLGMNFFEDKPVIFQPRLSFSTNYYLWNGEDAKPAEIENRTATALNFMLDLNALYSIGKNYTFQAGGGLGIFARYGILSSGVDSEDAGGTSDSTAGKDVDSINSWFWSDLHFLYPQIVFSYTYMLEGGWQVGAESHFYFPLGSLTSGDGFDGFMCTFSFKVIFPK